ncbi:MAG: PHP domain-containing protein [Clostridia bacterium]|nr:PHP domain-containing protein [Clostridia bacterium]
MKQHLFPQEGSFYRANLHCHSTCSDGRLSPEELKEIYKSAGYSVLAYSDHNVLIDHTDLNDEDFLALTSVELDVTKKGDQPGAYRPCYHINFYPDDPHNVTLPCYNPKYVWGKNQTEWRDNQPHIGEADYVRDYEKVNELLSEFARHGFIAMVNHPTWSVQTMEDYSKLEVGSFFALELYNHGCAAAGFDENNTHVFDELLRKGHRIFGTATDDNHNAHPRDTKDWDSLGGFVMIKAPELSHKAIYDALRAGSFYASNGPEIHDLYIEDGVLTVKTSPAVKIALTTGARQARVAYPKGEEAAITQASFDLSHIWPGYIRLTVTDEHGNTAWSNPVWGEFSGRTK